MPLSSGQLVVKSQELRKEKRFEEALAASLAAIEAGPENVDAWWQVTLNRRSLHDNDKALVCLRKTIELAPWFSYGWSQLGTLLAEMDNDEEVKEAFQTALRLKSDNLEALEALSNILSVEDDSDQDEEEKSVLERIEAHSWLSADQLNRFGILHFRAKSYFEAIRYWQRGAAISTGPALRFNLGLAFNNPEISQDADAVDMWRMALERWPDYEKPKKSLADLEIRLKRLAQQARTYKDSLLEADQWFCSYLSPYRLINPPEGLSFEDFDSKTIQKLKKALLQEIDLEEGKLSWMPGVTIDKSKAIGVCDELSDETKRHYHWLVYSNKSLLEFLEIGHHEHFLVSDASPLESIKALEEDEKFCEWISEPFVKQYDLVLTKAIERKNLVLLECLLDGRRWIAPHFTDRCFEGARRQVDRLIEPLREANDHADDRLPSVRDVERILNCNSLLEILNLLPAYFRDYQDAAAKQIRGIAISANNSHDDRELSKAILALTKKFDFKSVSLRHQLDEDFEKIEALIREERKSETKKTSGENIWEINKEGVVLSGKSGRRFIPVAKVSSVRWGILVTKEQYSKKYDIVFVVGSETGEYINFSWKAENNLAEGEKHFQDLVNAAFAYLFDPIIAKIERAICRAASSKWWQLRRR